MNEDLSDISNDVDLNVRDDAVLGLYPGGLGCPEGK